MSWIDDCWKNFNSSGIPKLLFAEDMVFVERMTYDVGAHVEEMIKDTHKIEVSMHPMFPHGNRNIFVQSYMLPVRFGTDAEHAKNVAEHLVAIIKRNPEHKMFAPYLILNPYIDKGTGRIEKHMSSRFVTL